MKQEIYIAAEFPGNLRAIQRLRSENSVFNEICDDLELLGRDLACFSEEQSLRGEGAYLDVRESYQALCQELADFLRRDGNTTSEF